uniref:ubiquitinyl hydrolase 1 n=1 Tax=Ascaris lumbricoides TaxID=6252 RepID=A0A0M3IMV4_ASCLU
NGGGPVPALYNLGNTCYVNSLLQALASSTAFVNWLCDLNISCVDGGKRSVLIEALRKIMLQLNEPSTGISSAADVIAALLAHRWTIPPNSEQDVYELLNVLITTWDEELATLRSQRVFSLLKVGNSSSSEDLVGAYSHITSSSDLVVPKGGIDIGQLRDVIPGSQSPQAALSFEHIKKAVADERRSRPPCLGMLATQLQCCQALCSYKMITLETLLRKFFCAEVIQGASCDRCVEMRNKTCSGLVKKQGFSKLPASLILRVERVGYLPSGALFKQADRFAFPETLDVRDLCFYRETMGKEDESVHVTAETAFRVLGGATSSTTHSDASAIPTIESLQNAHVDGVNFLLKQRRLLKYKYQLRSVIVHIGQPHSGHFITYRRGIGADNQNAWYKTSDSQVTRVTYSEVAASEAYMLFYDRILPSNRTL